jgi:hypothetical protein
MYIKTCHFSIFDVAKFGQIMAFIDENYSYKMFESSKQKLVKI